MTTSLRVPPTNNHVSSQTQQVQPPEEPPKAPPPSLWIAAGGIGVALVLGAALLFGLSKGGKAPVAITTQDVGKHHLPLHNWPDRPWIAYSTKYAAPLGDPIWVEQPYQGHKDCVGYENYVICISAESQNANSIWEFQPLPLGLESLARTRRPAEPDAPIASIVQRSFDRLFQEAVAQGQTDFTTESDLVRYWFGRSQSQPVCVSGPKGSPGQCLQVFTFQVLRWPQGSENPDDVKLWPLGTEAPRP